MGLKKFFKAMASVVLDIDDTSVPQEQVKMISDLFANYGFSFNSKNLRDLMKTLKRKHLVDLIIVAKTDGSIIASSEGNGLHEAITGTALFNYVSSELPKSKTLLVKQENSWFMVLHFNEKIFIIKAAASLSTIELHALAKEMELLMKKNPSLFSDDFAEKTELIERA